MPGNKKKPSVSVVIPAYNNHNLLLETLTSVHQQIGDYNIKIIIVDDHSLQPIGPIVLKKFPNIRVIRNKKNLCAGPARNEGIKLISNSDYVAFLDADDLWDPSFIDQSIKNIKKNNLTGSVAFSTPVFNQGIGLKFKIKIYLLSLIRDSFQIVFFFLNNKTVPRSAFYLCQLSHLVFKEKNIKGVLFDKNYNFGGEDWKFVIETMDKGKIGIIKQRLVRYRYHKKSLTQKPKNLKRKWDSFIQLFDE